MMRGTCGHPLPDGVGRQLELKGVGPDAVDFVTVCEECAELYRREGFVGGTLASGRRPPRGGALSPPQSR